MEMSAALSAIYPALTPYCSYYYPPFSTTLITRAFPFALVMMSIVDAGSPERLKACKGIFQFLATGTLLF